MRFTLLAPALLASLLLVLGGCSDPHIDAADEYMEMLDELEDVIDDIDIDDKDSVKAGVEKIEALEDRVKELTEKIEDEKISDDAEDYIEDEIEDDYVDQWIDLDMAIIKLGAVRTPLKMTPRKASSSMTAGWMTMDRMRNVQP